MSVCILHRIPHEVSLPGQEKDFRYHSSKRLLPWAPLASAQGLPREARGRLRSQAPTQTGGMGGQTTLFPQMLRSQWSSHKSPRGEGNH